MTSDQHLRPVLDRTPAEIIAAYEQEQQCLRKAHNSTFKRFLRYRRKLVTAGEYTRKELVLSALMWTACLLAQICVFTFVSNDILAATTVVATIGIVTATSSLVEMTRDAARVNFLAPIVIGMGGSLAVTGHVLSIGSGDERGVILVAVGWTLLVLMTMYLASFRESSATRQSLFSSVLSRLSLALFATPLYLMLCMIDLWVLRNGEHPVFAEPRALLVPFSDADARAELVVGAYQREIAAIRRDLLGPDSELEKNRAFYAAKLDRLRRRKARFEHRLGVVPDGQSDRSAPLREAIARQTAREDRFQSELRRLEEEIIPRVAAYLDELDDDIRSVQAYLVDEELIREDAEDAESDGADIVEARARTERAIRLHGQRVYLLLVALKDASVVRTLGTSDEAMCKSFQHQERLAERLADLEVTAEAEEEDGVLVHVVQ